MELCLSLCNLSYAESLDSWHITLESTIGKYLLGTCLLLTTDCQQLIAYKLVHILAVV